MTDHIRVAVPGDAEGVHAIYAPVVRDTAISFELEPPDVAAMAGRIAETLAEHPWLVCERAGAVAGYAYATTHRARPAYQWSVDVSVYVNPDARRGGVGRRLYTALFRLLALQGYRNAYAGIALPNAGSVGLHEAMGFRPVGVYRQVGFKLGAWHDVGWWQLQLGERVVPPPPPLPLAALADADVAAALRG